MVIIQIPTVVFLNICFLNASLSVSCIFSFSYFLYPFPPFSLFVPYFLYPFFPSLFSTILSSLPTISINSTHLQQINTQVIKSSMYLQFYNSQKYSILCFQLPTNERLFFISSSVIINQLIQLETSSNNIYTIRKQNYIYNQSLLARNPVSSSSLTSDSYVKSYVEI